MLSLAVDLIVAHVEGQSGQLASRDSMVYSTVRTSVATIVDGDKAGGLAALVDRSGLFVTFAVGVPPNSIELRLGDGRRISATFVGKDSSTQLAAYLTKDDVRNVTATRVAKAAPARGTQALALTPNGAARCAFTRTDGFGVLNGSRRILPIYELRFEGAPELVGGALIFNADGHLVSVVSAALMAESRNRNSQQFELGSNLVGRNGANLQSQLAPFGPGGMVVTYVPSLEVVRRAIVGLSSPEHRVVRPALGLFCVNDPTGGAQIQKVVAGSAAEKAGLKVGDVIVVMNLTQVHNQVDFARVMFDQTPGSKIAIVFLRGGSKMATSAIVGAAID